MGIAFLTATISSAIAGAGFTISPLDPSVGIRIAPRAPVHLDVLVGPQFEWSFLRQVTTISFSSGEPDVSDQQSRALFLGARAEARLRGMFHDGPFRFGWTLGAGGAMAVGTLWSPGSEPDLDQPYVEWFTWTGPCLTGRLSETWHIGGDVGLVRAAYRRSEGSGAASGVIPFTTESTSVSVGITPTLYLWVTYVPTRRDRRK